MPKANWRLINSPPASGPWNMAVDEAILEAVAQGAAPPSLRFYDWEPPCLSLGYAQPFSDVDRGRLEQQGWGIVRRPTGGRAILHTDELTYSVIVPVDDPSMAGGVLASYKRLAGALLAGLQKLSVPAGINAEKKENNPGEDEPICFEIPSNYEITVNGKKLIGSAQTRRKRSILQHGTVPLHGDLARIAQALVFPSKDARRAAGQRLLKQATTVEAALGARVSWQEAAQAFSEAFRKELDVALTAGELSSAERSRAEQLCDEKYAAATWTQRA